MPSELALATDRLLMTLATRASAGRFGWFVPTGCGCGHRPNGTTSDPIDSVSDKVQELCRKVQRSLSQSQQLRCGCTDRVGGCPFGSPWLVSFVLVVHDADDPDVLTASLGSTNDRAEGVSLARVVLLIRRARSLEEAGLLHRRRPAVHGVENSSSKIEAVSFSSRGFFEITARNKCVDCRLGCWKRHI
jgi:hypothetical protein